MNKYAKGISEKWAQQLEIELSLPGVDFLWRLVQLKSTSVVHSVGVEITTLVSVWEIWEPLYLNEVSESIAWFL